jgi:formate dehydrogenase maturation protein FdhE
MIRTYCDSCGDGGTYADIVINTSGPIGSRFVKCDLCKECWEKVGVSVLETVRKIKKGKE